MKETRPSRNQPDPIGRGLVVGRRRFGAGVLAAGAALAAGRAGVTLAATAAVKEKRRVFAHYMVCCPMSGRDSAVDKYVDEIRLAQSRGVDGFALNCGSWTQDPKYRAVAANIFAAAQFLASDFKLFFSPDGLDREETIAMVSEFYDHPNAYRFGGKPFLSAWAGDAEWAQSFLVPLANAGKVFTFVPFFYPEGPRKLFSGPNIARLVADNRFLDGFFYFGGGKPIESDPARSARIGRAWHDAGKTYMAPAMPYYRGLTKNYRLMEFHGFETMAHYWEAAIDTGAEWVEIVTWNDWGESTYVADFGSPSSTALWNGHWGPLLSHDAYLAASAYYMRWFKTGVRRIDRDQLFWFYRLSPRSSPGFKDPNHKVRYLPDGVETLEDRVFVSVFLAAPARVRIQSGARTYQFDIAEGAHHLSAAFALGAQKFSVERDGRSVLAGEGAFPVSEDNWGNYNYLSGQADAI